MQSYKSIWQNYTKSKNELTMEEYEKLQLEIAFLKKQLSSQAKLIKSLKEETCQDNLTKLWNKQKFDKDIDKIIELCQRYNKEASMLFIDLNNFKAINDSIGYLAGDYALQHIANTLKLNCRKNDEIYRLGSDEFVIIIPESSEITAQHKAFELSQIIENTSCLFKEREIKLSVSISTNVIDGSINKATIIANADKNMFKIKQLYQQHNLAS